MKPIYKFFLWKYCNSCSNHADRKCSIFVEEVFNLCSSHWLWELEVRAARVCGIGRVAWRILLKRLTHFSVSLRPQVDNDLSEGKKNPPRLLLIWWIPHLEKILIQMLTFFLTPSLQLHRSPYYSAPGQFCPWLETLQRKAPGGASGCVSELCEQAWGW